MKAKDRWNREHYTQVKISARPGLVAVFKESCAAAGTSMASVLARYMAEYAALPIQEPIPDLRTDKTKQPGTTPRAGRRKIIQEMLTKAESVLAAEQGYRDAIPESFAGRIADADEVLEQLETLVEALQDTYA